MSAWRTILPQRLDCVRDREELERWTYASTVEASAAKPLSDRVARRRWRCDHAYLADSTVTTVLDWRERYEIDGLAGLERHPRFVVRLTPPGWTYVEYWFGLVERWAARRGVFTLVKDLSDELRTYGPLPQ